MTIDNPLVCMVVVAQNSCFNETSASETIQPEDNE